MKSLYLRIYLTVVLALALFALASGWLLQRHLDDQRVRFDTVARERVAAWGDLLQRSLPAPEAPVAEQAAALGEWSQRLRMPMALDDAEGRRVAASDSFVRRDLDNPVLTSRLLPIRLDDGRTLWVTRPAAMRVGAGGRGGPGVPPGFGPGAGSGLLWAAWMPWAGVRGLPDGAGLVALLVVLFLAVAGGVWPVVRRLTRRLEALKQGVEAFGAGALHQRVAEDGHDEVAAVGASFNRAASRIEALLRSHQSLLANASHELRSPLARLKMAASLLEETPEAQRGPLKREIDTNIAELAALVEEVLLASRLEAASQLERNDPVALLGMAAEEAARVGANVDVNPGSDDLQVRGDERLLRRALRNLLENARRYGGDRIEVTLSVDLLADPAVVLVRVCDRGPGVPEAFRERIFEAFFRLPGHAEREGGVGLGLALVRQIATRHGGSVACRPRDGGGSCFELRLPR